ncbi:MAG: AMP-binding protein, partial [Zavarzinia sp.]|nr:AMP-binding protein [Zavarzinia sp.]
MTASPQSHANHDPIYPVPTGFAAQALVNAAGYAEGYRHSIEDPAGFWAEAGKRLDWITPYSPGAVRDVSFGPGDVHIRWFHDGTLNVAANCLDRHLATRGDKLAILWEGDSPADSRAITYRELHAEVSRFANALLGLGVKKGDRVTLYLPMIPEAAVAMLACARIGAIHSIVFGGFSPDSLAGRIVDCGSKVVVTADEGLRAGKTVPLKANTDKALEQCPDVTAVVVVRRTGGKTGFVPGR